MATSEHLGRLHRVESDLDILKPQVAGLQTDVQYIRSSIDQLVQYNTTQSGRAFPWGAIVSLVSVVVVVLGGFATMLTEPVAHRTSVNEQHIEELQIADAQNQYSHGRLDAQVEELRRQLESIDEHGSRVWNRSHPANDPAE